MTSTVYRSPPATSQPTTLKTTEKTTSKRGEGERGKNPTGAKEEHKQTLFEGLRQGNEYRKREMFEKMWSIEQKGAKREKKRFELYLNPNFKVYGVAWEKKPKIEKIGHPQIMLGGLGQIWIRKSFWESKKTKNVKLQKTHESFLAIFGKTVGHKGLKFGTGSFLTRIYNFVFIKIF